MHCSLHQKIQATKRPDSGTCQSFLVANTSIICGIFRISQGIRECQSFKYQAPHFRRHSQTLSATLPTLPTLPNMWVFPQIESSHGSSIDVKMIVLPVDPCWSYIPNSKVIMMSFFYDILCTREPLRFSTISQNSSQCSSSQRDDYLKILGGR